MVAGLATPRALLQIGRAKERCYTRSGHWNMSKAGGKAVNLAESGAISSLSIESFHQRVADHGTFLGGGAVAAITAAGAASLVQLVLDLAARRKSNAQRRPHIEEALDRATALSRSFANAADTDALALDRLLAAQKGLKVANDRGQYQFALVEAARAPLQIAEDCNELLQIIEENMRHATTFTVSDLGAAAALAFGALQAATMMCDVNLSLLYKEEGTDIQALQAMDDRSTSLVREGEIIASDIDQYCRSMIRMNG